VKAKRRWERALNTTASGLGDKRVPWGVRREYAVAEITKGAEKSERLADKREPRPTAPWGGEAVRTLEGKRDASKILNPELYDAAGPAIVAFTQGEIRHSASLNNQQPR